MRALPSQPGSAPAELPDHGTIARTIDEVLSQPAYRAEPTDRFQELWDEFWEWVADGFRSVFGGAADFLAGESPLAQFAFWWMVLVLVAILAHFVWTLLQLREPRAARSPDAAQARAELPPDASRALDDARAQAAAGRFGEAMHSLYAGTVRWLDDDGEVRFDESKTGGDYVRELSGSPRRTPFRRLLSVFYPVAFGGRTPNADAWAAMRASATELGVPS